MRGTRTGPSQPSSNPTENEILQHDLQPSMQSPELCRLRRTGSSCRETQNTGTGPLHPTFGQSKASVIVLRCGDSREGWQHDRGQLPRLRHCARGNVRLRPYAAIVTIICASIGLRRVSDVLAIFLRR